MGLTQDCFYKFEDFLFRLSIFLVLLAKLYFLNWSKKFICASRNILLKKEKELLIGLGLPMRTTTINFRKIYRFFSAHDSLRNNEMIYKHSHGDSKRNKLILFLFGKPHVAILRSRSVKHKMLSFAKKMAEKQTFAKKIRVNCQIFAVS